MYGVVTKYVLKPRRALHRTASAPAYQNQQFASFATRQMNLKETSSYGAVDNQKGNENLIAIQSRLGETGIASSPASSLRRVHSELPSSKVSRFAYSTVGGLGLAAAEPLLPFPFLSAAPTNDINPTALALVVCIGSFLFGFHIGFSSPFEDDVRRTTGLSGDEIGFVFSLISIGAIVGCTLTGPFASTSGRLTAIVWSALPYCVGSIIMAFADRSIVLLSIGRVFCGAGVGMSSVLVPLYIAEIAPPALRGTLGSASSFFMAAGLVAVNAAGIPAVTVEGWWRLIMLCSVIPALLMAIIMLIFGVETPRYLASIDQQDEALKVLRFLRGPNYDCEGELGELMDYDEVGVGSVKHTEQQQLQWQRTYARMFQPELSDVETWNDVNDHPVTERDVSAASASSAESPSAYHKTTSGLLPEQPNADRAGVAGYEVHNSSFMDLTEFNKTDDEPMTTQHDEDSEETETETETASTWSLMMKRENLIPFSIGVSLQCLQQLSGINAFMFHTKSLFMDKSSGPDNASPVDYSAYIALYGAIAVNALQMIMGGIAVLLMERAGRRTWLIGSCIGMGVASLALSYASAQHYSSHIKILIVMSYVAMFALGVGPMPWLICSEIFPSAIRSTAVSIATTANWSMAFLVTASYPLMESYLGESGVFMSYGLLVLTGGLYVLLVLPETAGKSLEEIEDLFITDKNTKTNK